MTEKCVTPVSRAKSKISENFYSGMAEIDVTWYFTNLSFQNSLTSIIPENQFFVSSLKSGNMELRT